MNSFSLAGVAVAEYAAADRVLGTPVFICVRSDLRKSAARRHNRWHRNAIRLSVAETVFKEKRLVVLRSILSDVVMRFLLCGGIASFPLLHWTRNFLFLSRSIRKCKHHSRREVNSQVNIIS